MVSDWTGHLVLSTLHTNDAPSSITRLLDLGVEPYLAASSLNATIAQRLVRVVCPHCRREHAIDWDQCLKAGWTPENLDYLRTRKTSSWSEGQGCEKCVQTGFLGRTAIYEILFIDDPLRDLVYNRSPAGQIKRSAVERGMKTLRQAGLCKIAEGVTTFEEVRAVTQMDLL